MTLEERVRCNGFAKRLALAGAALPIPVKVESTEKEDDDTGMEIMRAEVIVEDEMPASAAKEAAAAAQRDPPETRAAPSASNSTMEEQDLDLILNVEDHDHLDFEPEEDILDDTVEVNSFNKLFSLRPDFRMGRISRLQGRSEDGGCHNITHHKETNFITTRKTLFINEFTTIIIYLYYLYFISRTSCPQISIVILNDRIVC